MWFDSVLRNNICAILRARVNVCYVYVYLYIHAVKPPIQPPLQIGPGFHITQIKGTVSFSKFRTPSTSLNGPQRVTLPNGRFREVLLYN